LELQLPPHTIDDCRAAVEAGIKRKLASPLRLFETTERPLVSRRWAEDWTSAEDSAQDPAPSGLTAAQEIRLAIALKAMKLADKATDDDGVEADDAAVKRFADIVTGVVAPIAAMVEHGNGIPNTAVCPDPSLHDEDLRGLAKQFLNQRDEAHEQRDKAYEWRDAVEEANRVLGVKFDGTNARVAELERQRDVAEERLSRISGLLAAVEDDPPHGEIPAQAIADVFAWVPEDDRAICAEHGDEGLGDGEATT
jgi:hypothetical protein